MKHFICSLIVFLSTTSSFVAQDLEVDLNAVFEDYNLMGMSVWMEVQEEAQQFHFGLKDFNRNLSIDQNTQYRIASISKSFTALGLLKLYSDGNFALDDDISSYLGYTVRNPSFPNTPITFRMLLSHTSSLQDGDGYSTFLSATYNQIPIPNIQELIVSGGNFHTPNMWRNNAPGTYFAYSNINFGLIGTLIEVISNQRFDVFMKSEILEPLAIAGSFNVSDINNINDVAVLYRATNGTWNPQWDNYQGVTPTPPDLSNYTLGTNGLYFAPQGGLRISAADTGKFLKCIATNGASSNLAISESVLEEMKTIAWNYSGNNGDNYFGLFNRWGLGIQHANVFDGDAICNTLNATALGHPGEAYGLISDAYFFEAQDVAFTFITNGKFTPYQSGNTSSFYQVEEAVFEVLCTYFELELGLEDSIINNLSITPNPADQYITITRKVTNNELTYQLFDILGKSIISKQTSTQKEIRIPIASIQQGVYFLKISENNKTFTQKISIK